MYGYADGDPVNFDDPFGLCPDKENPACSLGQRIRAGIEASINRAFERIGDFGNALRDALPGLARAAAVDVALAGLPVVGELRAGRRVAAVAEGAGRFLSESRHLRGVNAARKDFSRIGATADEVVGAISRASGWESVTAGALAGGQVRVGTGTVRYTLQSLKNGEAVLNAWIP